VRSVCGLALSFLGLAGLYYYLQKPLPGADADLVYVGAICITIMFAMMLTDPQDQPVTRGSRVCRIRSTCWWPVAGGGLDCADHPGGLMAQAAKEPAGTIQELGRALLFRYGFAFEVMSVVLLDGQFRGAGGRALRSGGTKS